MSLFAYMIWSPAPNIIPGYEIPRWYGLLFAMGFIVSQQIMYYLYRKDARPEKDIDILTVHMILGTILGARLGHCLFYDPLHYLSNPLLILKVWEGGLASHGGALGILAAVYVFVNYDIKVKFIPIIPGLIGIPKSFKSKKKKREGQSFLWVVDRLVIVVAITGAMIRTGNFINSEIIGKPTNSESGVVFSRSLEEVILKNPDVDYVEFEMSVNREAYQNGEVPINLIVHYQRDSKFNEVELKNKLLTQLKQVRGYSSVAEHILIPGDIMQIPINVYKEDVHFVANVGIYGIARHPAQLYEALYCIVLFLLLFYLWANFRHMLPEGFTFGLFLALLWALRFADEFFKENQVAFEEGLPLNMGQILSIPLFLVGILVMIYSFKKGKRTEKASR